MAKRGRRKRPRPDSAERTERLLDRPVNGADHMAHISKDNRQTKGNKRPKRQEEIIRISQSIDVDDQNCLSNGDTDQEMIIVDDPVSDGNLQDMKLDHHPATDLVDDLDHSDLSPNMGSKVMDPNGQTPSDSSGSMESIVSDGYCASLEGDCSSSMAARSDIDDCGTEIKTEIFDPTYEMNDLLVSDSVDCMMDIPLFHEVDSLMNIKHEDHLNDTVFYLPMSYAMENAAAVKLELPDGIQGADFKAVTSDASHIPNALVLVSQDGNKIELTSPASGKNSSLIRDDDDTKLSTSSHHSKSALETHGNDVETSGLNEQDITRLSTATALNELVTNGLPPGIGGVLTTSQIKGNAVSPLGPVILNQGLVAVPVALTQELLKGTIGQQPILYSGLVGNVGPEHTETPKANSAKTSNSKKLGQDSKSSDKLQSPKKTSPGGNKSSSRSPGHRPTILGSKGGKEKTDLAQVLEDVPEIDRFVICSDHTMECVLCAFTTESYSAFKSHIICSHPCWRITKKLSKNRLLVEKSVRASTSFSANFETVQNKVILRKEDEQELSKMSKKNDKNPRKRQLFERNKRLFKCSICLRLFVFEGSVVNHVTDHHGQDRPYDYIHISNDHGQSFGPIYRCQHKNCYFSCESEQELDKHNLDRHTQVIYRCQLCGYTADSADAVRVHGIRMHQQQLARFDSTPSPNT